MHGSIYKTLIIRKCWVHLVEFNFTRSSGCFTAFILGLAFSQPGDVWPQCILNDEENIR